MARRENYWPHSDPNPADSESGQHPCSRGDWCYGRRITTEDGKAVITPAFTPRAYCEKCWAHICECLNELPQAYGRLGDELGEPSRRGEAVRVPFGPRLPLRENVDALMRLMATTLCGWEARVRAQLRAPRDPGKPVHTAEAVAAAAGTLVIQQSVLLALQPKWMTRTYPLPAGKPGDAHHRPGPGACRRCGRVITYSAASGLWWAADGTSEITAPCEHEPQEVPVAQPWAPVPPDLEAEHADREIVRLGVDYVALMVELGAKDAGTEILRLHYRAQAILGECGQQAETLDGVPCRKCEDMALERAEPPSDPALPAMWSQCASCRDQMSHEDFAAWAAMYAKWADDAAPTCKRCQAERCGECVYPGCACQSPQPHPARHAAVA